MLYIPGCGCRQASSVDSVDLEEPYKDSLLCRRIPIILPVWRNSNKKRQNCFVLKGSGGVHDFIDGVLNDLLVIWGFLIIIMV